MEHVECKDMHTSASENQKLHIFEVFDGHGGKEVAQFVKAHFTKELFKTKSFIAGKLKMPSAKIS